jgi:hypothetical protein
MPTCPMTAPPYAHLDIFRRAFHALDWESHRAHELAIFSTFAVPSISKILEQTGEFAQRGQRRYDDTVALLREIGRDGPDSPRGRAAIRHLNRIHRPYDISDGDLRYVLATFVVVPVRWIAWYGWRDLTDHEVRASVSYYQALGRLMGIRQIPSDYAGFASYLDAYERDKYEFSQANHRLAISLTEVMGAWFPRPLRPLARLCIVAGLGKALRQALGLSEPSGLIRAGVHVALRSRAVLLRLIPPLRRGRKGPRRLRSYPHGYSLSELGPAHVRDPAGGSATSPEVARIGW